VSGRFSGEGGQESRRAPGQDPIRSGSQAPFAVPPERRDPVRRLRGRLVAPVTIWTAGHPPGGAGLTVSSVLVAEGQPARLLGLIDPTSAFWEAAQEPRAFVVHVLAAGDRALAERFSEVRPPIRSPFERLEVADSPWGPLLGANRPRAACRLAGSTPVGYAELVEGVIEQLELPGLEDPLAYLHGRCRSVQDLITGRPRGVSTQAPELRERKLASPHLIAPVIGMTAEACGVPCPAGRARMRPVVADRRHTRYRGLAEVHVLLRNPQVELVPCRRRHYGPGVADTSKTMEGGTSI
jgi:3-hydroxy-9,10-secoandrosta-1,3,5(10)-triene-9,17-dione monooxygenase reductase component